MNDALIIVAIGIAIVVALLACYRLVKWVGRQRTLRSANQIARSFASEQALRRASPEIRRKLERYRAARVRESLGAPNSLLPAATELVCEHRLHALEQTLPRAPAARAQTSKRGKVRGPNR